MKKFWPQIVMSLIAVAAIVAAATGHLHPAVAVMAAGAVGVSFNSIPNAIRVPFVAAEFDNTRATQGPALLPYRALLIGQRRSTGTGVANTLYRITSAADALLLGGRGSMLHRQAIAWFANNQFTELWVGVLDDNGAGAIASGTITVTGPATATGTIYLYIAGVLIPVAVTNADSANTIAASINAAINANLDLPVTSAVVTNVCTVAFRHKGLVGNDCDMRVNYQDGEKLPAGVTLAFVQLTGGTSNPILTTLIASLGDRWFQIWAHPYTDATSLTAIEAELSSRFGPMRMIDGVAISSSSGTQSTLGTLGDSRNSQHSCIVAQPGKNPVTPPAEFGAAVAAVAAYYANIDPARPFQTLPIAGVRAPAEADQFTFTERNLELYDGISTSKVAAGGLVQIERLVTTYQTNPAGAADESYLDVTTMLTLLYLRYAFRNLILAKYPRHKLASDGTRFGAGQAVITPKIGKAEAIGWFRQMEEAGLVEGFDQFKRDLIVERNASNPNRLDFLLPPDIINQFVVGAAKIQFLL